MGPELHQGNRVELALMAKALVKQPQREREQESWPSSSLAAAPWRVGLGRLGSTVELALEVWEWVSWAQGHESNRADLPLAKGGIAQPSWRAHPGSVDKGEALD